jgi:hypothetical protein
VIEGATGAEPLVLETTPAQPEFANPASTATKTRVQRFIMRLQSFHRDPAICIGQEQSAGKRSFAQTCQGGRQA